MHLQDVLGDRKIGQLIYSILSTPGLVVFNSTSMQCGDWGIVSPGGIICKVL